MLDMNRTFTTFLKLKTSFRVTVLRKKKKKGKGRCGGKTKVQFESVRSESLSNRENVDCICKTTDVALVKQRGNTRKRDSKTTAQDKYRLQWKTKKYQPFKNVRPTTDVTKRLSITGIDVCIHTKVEGPRS